MFDAFDAAVGVGGEELGSIAFRHLGQSLLNVLDIHSKGISPPP